MTSPASDSLSEIMSRLDARIRRVDEERWLSSRYAKAADRASLIILYAFYYELARVRVAVSDQTMGLIRFQWWREALEGIEAGHVREHDLVIALAEEIAAGRFSTGRLTGLIDRHQTAFIEQDRGLEPEGELANIAADLLLPNHGQDALIAEIAPEWARLRRQAPATQALGPVSVASEIRPALAHFRLRHSWAKGRALGPMQKRLAILLAAFIGRI